MEYMLLILIIITCAMNRSDLQPNSASLATDDEVFTAQDPFSGRNKVGTNHQHHHQQRQPTSPTESDPVLLCLTHDHATPFGLSFDEPLWKSCIESLKPLGLSVLLNTCHPDTQAHYTTFCGHLTNEATFTQDLVPVSQRR